MTNKVAKNKYGKTYPVVNSPETMLKDFWLLPFEQKTRTNGVVYHENVTQLEDGFKLIVETPAPFKVALTKLFDVLMESLWTHSYHDKQEELTVESIREALGITYSRLPKDVAANINEEEYKQQQRERLRSVLNPKQYDLLRSSNLKIETLYTKPHEFIKEANQLVSINKRGNLRNTIVLSVEGLLNRTGRHDHRKAQRDLLFDELKTLQGLTITVQDAGGSWYNYVILKGMAHDKTYDRIALTFTDEYLAHFASDKHSIKFLSSQARDALTSKHSLGLMRYLQISGSSRQRDGTFGLKRTVTREELIKVLSLEDAYRPDITLKRAFRDIEDACGIKYDYNKGQQVYTITKDSAAIKDTLHSGFVDHDKDMSVVGDTE